MDNDLDTIVDALSSATSEVDSMNVITNGNSTELQYSETYNVHFPKPEERLVISVSDLRRVSSICNEAKKNKFSSAELFLSLSALFIGAFLSAFISKVTYELSILSVFLYNICPTLGFTCGAIYFFERKHDFHDAQELADKIKDCLEKYIEENEKETF